MAYIHPSVNLVEVVIDFECEGFTEEWNEAEQQWDEKPCRFRGEVEAHRDRDRIYAECPECGAKEDRSV